MSLLKLFKHLLLDQFMFYGGGGKGGGGSAPSYPDPTTVANATTATNTQTAAYNKALNLNNYSNPFGSQQTTATGTDPKTGAPIYNTNISANPQLQGLFNGTLGQTQNAAGINQYASNGVGNLIGQSQNVNNNLSGLQGQYQGLNQGLGGLQSQYQGLNQNIGALGGQYSNLQGQLAGINSSIDPNAGKQAQQQGQDAAYKAQTQYLDPQFAQQGESLNNSLANQGLAPGSQAYNNAQLNQSNAKQQAYSNASNQAILTGSQIGAQSLNNQLNAASSKAGLVGQQGSMVGNQAGLFGLQGSNLGQQAGVYGQQGANLGAQAGLYGQQSSNLGQQAGMYGQQNSLAQQNYGNLASIGSMLPGYTGTGQASAAPADISSLYNNQYQSQLAGYNAGQSSSNSMMSGLFGLGSSAMMAYGMSDRRAKRAIKRVATFPNGLGVYTYRYMWEKAGVRHIGFMADEVRKIAPRAVLRFADGFDRVNYQLAAA